MSGRVDESGCAEDDVGRQAIKADRGASSPCAAQAQEVPKYFPASRILPARVTLVKRPIGYQFQYPLSRWVSLSLELVPGSGVFEKVS